MTELIAGFAGLWLGVGMGLCVADVNECGWPNEFRTWVDLAICPVFWPVAVWRNWHG
jgi:hypothetical protein